MTEMSLNTAILSFAFSGMLARRHRDYEAQQWSSQAADEAASQAIRPGDDARPVNVLRQPT